MIRPRFSCAISPASASSRAETASAPEPAIRTRSHRANAAAVASVPIVGGDFGGLYGANAVIGLIFAATGPVAVILAVGVQGGLSPAELAERYGWEPYQATTFVLTDLAPVVDPIRSKITGGRPLSSTTRLVLDVARDQATQRTGPTWPRSVESQIQEGDTGDIFLVGGTGASTTIDDIAKDATSGWSPRRSTRAPI